MRLSLLLLSLLFQVVRELLGENVSETSLMQFLGVIEQRSNEIMYKLSLVTPQEGANNEHLLAAMGQNLPPKRSHVVVGVQAPSTADDGLDDLDDGE